MNESAFERFPILQTDRLSLREIGDADQRMIFDFNSDADAIRYVPRAPYETLDEAIAKVKSFREGFAARKGVWWVFELKDTGESIGYGGLFEIDAESSKAEIGYGILKPYWGKGYVSEAVAEMSRFGSHELGLHRIYGQVDPGNAASARILLKLGYEKEGCLRDDIFARGRFFDMDVFALINPMNRPAE